MATKSVQQYLRLRYEGAKLLRKELREACAKIIDSRVEFIDPPKQESSSAGNGGILYLKVSNAKDADSLADELFDLELDNGCSVTKVERVFRKGVVPKWLEPDEDDDGEGDDGDVDNWRDDATSITSSRVSAKKEAPKTKVPIKQPKRRVEESEPEIEEEDVEEEDDSENDRRRNVQKGKQKKDTVVIVELPNKEPALADAERRRLLSPIMMLEAFLQLVQTKEGNEKASSKRRPENVEANVELLEKIVKNVCRLRTDILRECLKTPDAMDTAFDVDSAIEQIERFSEAKKLLERTSQQDIDSVDELAELEGLFEAEQVNMYGDGDDDDDDDDYYRGGSSSLRQPYGVILQRGDDNMVLVAVLDNTKRYVLFDLQARAYAKTAPYFYVADTLSKIVNKLQFTVFTESARAGQGRVGAGRRAAKALETPIVAHFLKRGENFGNAALSNLKFDKFEMNLLKRRFKALEKQSSDTSRIDDELADMKRRLQEAETRLQLMRQQFQRDFSEVKSLLKDDQVVAADSEEE